MATTTIPKTKKKRIPKNINYSSIALLNQPSHDGGAYISTKAFGHLNSGRDAWCVRINIVDCHNKATLHGSLGNPNDRDNTLFKIDTMIQELTNLKTAIQNKIKEHNLKVYPKKY